MRFATSANVILTFDRDPQEIYDADVNVALPANEADRQRFEIDVVKDLLAGSKRDHGDLVKISVCYNTAHGHRLGAEEKKRFDDAANYLCRHSAKYYFQPNQRDDNEEAIVAALGIASSTHDFA